MTLTGDHAARDIVTAGFGADRHRERQSLDVHRRVAPLPPASTHRHAAHWTAELRLPRRGHPTMARATRFNVAVTSESPRKPHRLALGTAGHIARPSLRRLTGQDRLMTRPPHLRSWLLSATLVVLAVAAWLVLAPTQIGGETSYVTTSGISMAPRFHTGDLAVVRPADALQGRRHRRLPQHDAAHGRPAPHHRRQGRSLRLQGRQQRLRRSRRGPPAPTLVGRLSLRVAHGGRVLAWLHTPFMAALLLGGLAALLLLGATQQRRRRDRRRPNEARAARAARSSDRERDLRRRHADRVHRIRRGRRGLPRAQRARVLPPGDQADRGQDSRTPRRSASATTPRRPPGRSTPTAS